jgi:hypothetical protein
VAACPRSPCSSYSIPETTLDTAFSSPSPAHDEASDEAVAAFERLEEWLTGPRGPVTELAEETLRAAAKALLEGQNGYFHKAEDGLEALKLRNGKTEGDDIPDGLAVAKADDFQADVDAVLDALHERMFLQERDPLG